LFSDREKLGNYGIEEEEEEYSSIQHSSLIQEKSDRLNIKNDSTSSSNRVNHYQSLVIQKENLLNELNKKDSSESDLWPKRFVNLDVEFPNVSEATVEVMKSQGLVKDDNPMQAAAILQAIKEKKKKEKAMKNLEQKEMMRPEWHRQCVAVDELNISNKLLLENPKEERENSFNQIGIMSESLLEALNTKWKITKPTEIQKMAIPEILKGSNIFVADQTGMGKTLCYILPMLARLKTLESRPNFRRRGQRARAIILAPTRELVEQVVGIVTVCLQATEYAHMRVFGMAGGLSNDRKEQNGFTPGLDILVTTGDRLSFHVDKLHFNLDDTKIVIVDEADTIFSIDTLKIQLLNLIYRLEVSSLNDFNYPMQWVWVSATVSEPFAEFIADKFPDTVQAFHPKIHKTVDGLKQHFLFGKGDFKKDMLLETLQRNKGKRTMIFCNSLDRCKLVHTLLDSRGYKTSLTISTQASHKRATNFSEFSRGQTPILISTDLASRGIDTTIQVEHVILFDFPQNVIDYIHRIGRTARNGTRGLATSFIGKWDQALAQKIRSAFENESSLSSVSTKLRSLEKKKKKLKISGKIKEEYLDQQGNLKKNDLFNLNKKENNLNRNNE
jgi:superfamily II DNA/RNA helicase